MGQIYSNEFRLRQSMKHILSSTHWRKEEKERLYVSRNLSFGDGPQVKISQLPRCLHSGEGAF